MRYFWYTALLPLFLFSCKPKDLQYLSFDRLEVVKIGYPDTRLKFDVWCVNPNPYALKLESLEAEVHLDEKYLGKASLEKSIEVPRKDTFHIPVLLDIKTGAALNQALKLASSLPDSAATLISLNGNARLNKSGIFLNYPIKYRERKTLKR